jgi:hypothetical protein
MAPLVRSTADYGNTILLRYRSLSYLAAAEKKVALEVEPVRLRWYIMRVCGIGSVRACVCVCERERKRERERERDLPGVDGFITSAASIVDASASSVVPAPATQNALELRQRARVALEQVGTHSEGARRRKESVRGGSFVVSLFFVFFSPFLGRCRKYESKAFLSFFSSRASLRTLPIGDPMEKALGGF